MTKDDIEIEVAALCLRAAIYRYWSVRRGENVEQLHLILTDSGRELSIDVELWRGDIPVEGWELGGQS